jgi:ribosomal protein S18 acetylase RimI-like enzyme
MLDLLYQDWPEPARRQQVESLLDQARAGAFDLSGLWGAWRRHRPVAVLMTQHLAKPLLAVWPPVGRGSEHCRAVMELCQAAFDAARGQGKTHVQALIDPSLADAHDQMRILRRVGLEPVTTLEFLTREVDPRPRLQTPAARFSWIEWDAARSSQFEATLHATYDASLDVPEVSGIRSMRELIDQLQIQGRFDPHSWLLGILEQAPEQRGILILAPSPHRTGHWEIQYLGLVPEARGRRLGRCLLLEAFHRAAGQARRLDLAVDQRNTPASALYQSAGFERFSSRILMLGSL